MTRLILLWLSGLLIPFPCSADSLRGVVVSVANGTTITIVDDSHLEYKIRLAGLDAPDERQGYGGISKARLTYLMFQKEVTVAWFREDRNGRIVGKVMIDGTDIGLKQLKAGLAWHRKGPQVEESLEDRKQYAEAEESARRHHRGLWEDNALFTAWEFRHKNE